MKEWPEVSDKLGTLQINPTTRNGKGTMTKIQNINSRGEHVGAYRTAKQLHIITTAYMKGLETLLLSNHETSLLNNSREGREELLLVYRTIQNYFGGTKIV